MICGSEMGVRGWYDAIILHLMEGPSKHGISTFVIPLAF